jgi:hypothetical protein
MMHSRRATRFLTGRRSVSPASSIKFDWKLFETQAQTKRLQSIDYKHLMMVKAGESEYSALLKTQKLLRHRHAQNAETVKLRPIGTYLERGFSL